MTKVRPRSRASRLHVRDGPRAASSNAIRAAASGRRERTQVESMLHDSTLFGVYRNLRNINCSRGGRSTFAECPYCWKGEPEKD